MYLYVELWTPKPNWLELSAAEREEYFETVGSEIAELTQGGTEIVGFAVNDEETDQRIDHRYLATWTMPSKEDVHKLEENLSEAGWYDYFDQENARGELVAPEDAFNDMIGL